MSPKSRPRTAFDLETIANILVDAYLTSVEETAEKYKITSRTIRNYRTRLQSDPELSQLFRVKLDALKPPPHALVMYFGPDGEVRLSERAPTVAEVLEMTRAAHAENTQTLVALNRRVRKALKAADELRSLETLAEAPRQAAAKIIEQAEAISPDLLASLANLVESNVRAAEIIASIDVAIENARTWQEMVRRLHTPAPLEGDEPTPAALRAN